jgi:hypothetical protein
VFQHRRRGTLAARNRRCYAGLVDLAVFFAGQTLVHHALWVGTLEASIKLMEVTMELKLTCVVKVAALGAKTGHRSTRRCEPASVAGKV